MLVDTHCHVYSEYYSDINEVLLDAKKSGVSKIISAGVDDVTNRELINISKDFDDMFICLGIHPEYANSYKQSDIDFIKNNISTNKIVAIGEIGLDYHYEGYNKDAQIKLFKKQLDLAQKNNIPVVIHSREAVMDTINILKEYKLKGVIHSFSGSKEVAIEYIKMGYKLGINGVVTFKNAHIKEVIKEIGIENIVLETDSPYLTPEPFRGKTNNPSNTIIIADFLSNYLNISFSEIEKITNTNVYNIFNFHA